MIEAGLMAEAEGFLEDLVVEVFYPEFFAFVQETLHHEHREGEFALECLGAGVSPFGFCRRNEELFEGVPNGSRKVGHLVGLVLIVVLVLGRRVSNRFLKK